jgi:TatD DNase family protein
MLRELPAERILTETDAPYQPPEPGARNEPANVVGTIAYLAELRAWSVEEGRERVWANFAALIGKRRPTRILRA